MAVSKRIFIFGSTGTLGKKAFDLSLKLGFDIVGLTAYKNLEELKKQILLSKPSLVSLDDEFLEKIDSQNVKTCPLKEVHKYLLELKPDLVLFLSSGIFSARSIEVCLENGIRIGIANKESIIAFGEILFEGKEYGDQVIPIDSETSAIFQLLIGEDKDFLDKVILTASGGPFFGRTREELKNVSIRDVLMHPNWQMGNKITVDSANLVNKAFEIIETHFLFNLPYSKIDVVVQRESIIHAMVQFLDGEVKALMSVTDMAIPIQYALTYPDRKKGFEKKYIDFASLNMLSFYPIEHEIFPLFDGILSYAMLGGTYLPTIVAIDEVLVDSFLRNDISFLEIEDYFFELLNKIEYKKIMSLEEAENVYNSVKIKTLEFLRRKK